MRNKLLLLASAALLLPVSTVLGLPINQLVVFGDSLSDTGNVYEFSHGAIGAAPAYQNGRFTDGPDTAPSTSSPTGLWIDQFAAKLNLASPSPFLSGGTNFAVGSAQTGTNPAYDGKSLEAPYVDQQIALYTANAKISSTALYVIWAGGNDLLGGNGPLTAVNNLSANIAALASGGAKNFLWLNVPNVGQVPDATALGPIVSATLNAEALAFNAAYSNAIPQLEAKYGINIIPVDVYTLFSQILSNPSAYGFTNTTDPAQGNLTANPNQYVFWDGLHPTTAADALIANLAYNDVQAAFTPEPAAFGLVIVGLVVSIAAGFARVRQRRSA